MKTAVKYYPVVSVALQLYPSCSTSINATGATTHSTTNPTNSCTNTIDSTIDPTHSTSMGANSKPRNTSTID